MVILHSQIIMTQSKVGRERSPVLTWKMTRWPFCSMLRPVSASVDTQQKARQRVSERRLMHRSTLCLLWFRSRTGTHQKWNLTKSWALRINPPIGPSRSSRWLKLRKVPTVGQVRQKMKKLVRPIGVPTSATLLSRKTQCLQRAHQSKVLCVRMPSYRSKVTKKSSQAPWAQFLQKEPTSTTLPILLGTIYSRLERRCSSSKTLTSYETTTSR